MHFGTLCMQNLPTGNSVPSHAAFSRRKYPQIPSVFTIPCVLLLTMESRTSRLHMAVFLLIPLQRKLLSEMFSLLCRNLIPGTLSSENALTFKILDTYLKNASTGTDYLLYQEPLGPVSGIHTQLPVLLSEYSFYDTQDVETYLALLKENACLFWFCHPVWAEKSCFRSFYAGLPGWLCSGHLPVFLSIWVKRIIWSVHLANGSRHWIFLPENKKDSFRKENIKLVTERDLSSLSKSDHRYQIAERKRNKWTGT